MTDAFLIEGVTGGSHGLIRKGCALLALAVVPLASAAAIPLAASTDTVAFYPMTESAVGTVFKTLRQDGQLFGTNTLMRVEGHGNTFA